MSIKSVMPSNELIRATAQENQLEDAGLAWGGSGTRDPIHLRHALQRDSDARRLNDAK